MAELAILGHATRGKEVIEILEMLGGHNIHYMNASDERNYYYNSTDNVEILSDSIKAKRRNNYTIYTLKEFLDKFPYKVGDKVSSKKLKNYEISMMQWDKLQDKVSYKLKGMGWYRACELQPYKEETMETITIDDFKANTKEWLIDKLHDMIISDAIKNIGDIYDELHKPEYPKTFIEVLNFWHPDRQLEDDYQRCYKKDLIEKFQDLLYARDAYWKIAGEQMGLGKPWEPNWLNTEQDKFVLYTHDDVICLNRFVLGYNVLAFPTKEIRDTFYENFKVLIEECKEFL